MGIDFSRWVIDKMERWLTQYLYYFLNHCRVNCGILFFALHINLPNLLIVVIENTAIDMWCVYLYIKPIFTRDRQMTKQQKKKIQNYYKHWKKERIFLLLADAVKVHFESLNERTSWQNEGENEIWACKQQPPSKTPD